MEELLAECALEAALNAGKLLKEGFGSAFKISNKEGRNNLVTEYDIKSEKTIIEFIQSKFPDHTYLAEESGKTGIHKSQKVRWIIDPLDGTVNFAHNIPIFSVSIAAELDGELLCGVIYQPVLDEVFLAVRSKGTFFNGVKVNVSESKDIGKSFLVTGFPYNVDNNPYNCVDSFVRIVLSGIPVRRLGSAALDLAYVSCGRFDGFWEINLNPWDVSAGVLMVMESGGRVTQYDNSKYNVFAETIVATNGGIHEQVLKVING
jgi:myo-inositol-1(or 4)-monophosphatase